MPCSHSHTICTRPGSAPGVQAVLSSLGYVSGPASTFSAAVGTISSELSALLAGSSVKLLEVSHWLPALTQALGKAMTDAGSDILVVNLREPGTVQVRLLYLLLCCCCCKGPGKDVTPRPDPAEETYVLTI